jgi:hypothetical protein
MPGGAGTTRLVEIRSYALKPGSGEEFHRLVVLASVPMLGRWGIDVVRFGPSLHDVNAYYLVRAYDSMEELERSEADFYGSDEWRLGPAKPSWRASTGTSRS